jgi:large-conductance mechanosensitive channel
MASAADSNSLSRDQAYHEYLKAYTQSEATSRRDNRILMVVWVTVIAGVIVFGVIPLMRKSKAALEISKQHQKTLEEIRDLLKKQ